MARYIYLSIVKERNRPKKSIFTVQSVKLLWKPRRETPKLSGSGVRWGVGMKAAQRTGYFSWALKGKCQLLSKWEWGVVGVQDEERGTQGNNKKPHANAQRYSIFGNHMHFGMASV